MGTPAHSPDLADMGFESFFSSNTNINLQSRNIGKGLDILSTPDAGFAATLNSRDVPPNVKSDALSEYARMAHSVANLKSKSAKERDIQRRRDLLSSINASAQPQFFNLEDASLI